MVFIKIYCLKRKKKLKSCRWVKNYYKKIKRVKKIKVNFRDFKKILGLYNINLLFLKNWAYYDVITDKINLDLNLSLYFINFGYLSPLENSGYKLDYYKIQNFIPILYKLKHVFFDFTPTELFYFLKSKKKEIKIMFDLIIDYKKLFFNFFSLIDKILIGRKKLELNLNCVWEILDDKKDYFSSENNYLRQYLFFNFDEKKLKKKLKKINNKNKRKLNVKMKQILKKCYYFEEDFLNKFNKNFSSSVIRQILNKNHDKFLNYLKLNCFEKIYLGNFILKNITNHDIQTNNMKYNETISICKYDLSDFILEETILNKEKKEDFYIDNLVDKDKFYDVWYPSKDLIKNFNFNSLKENEPECYYLNFVQEEFKYFKKLKVNMNKLKKHEIFIVNNFDNASFKNFKNIYSYKLNKKLKRKKNSI